uniref:Uncharacterized protein n=1 Tax=Anguilla anguilla TaxID=7936 RepID=A0A0E9PK55_ANGAN
MSTGDYICSMSIVMMQSGRRRRRRREEEEEMGAKCLLKWAQKVQI